MKIDPHKTIICLMGPTASGKTSAAVKLVQHFPCDIISVDSAMVYRGMDIGTAKPDAATLKLAPHRLIDICDPKDPYSAGQFRADALQAIHDIHAKGHIPLLVGGTMLYFRALQQGLAPLPKADKTLRAELQKRGELEGWEKLHAELGRFDPIAANRIQPRDSQRIQRALEVYLLTGKNMTTWQQEDTHSLQDYHMINFALIPHDRTLLHESIAERFNVMLKNGFQEEVRQLYERGDLTSELPSIRSVGYKQMWDYLSGHSTYEEMREKAIIATRQLAKRQLTWLRSWPEIIAIESQQEDVFEQIAKLISSDLL